MICVYLYILSTINNGSRAVVFFKQSLLCGRLNNKQKKEDGQVSVALLHSTQVGH